jgi:hypothetical protein
MRVEVDELPPLATDELRLQVTVVEATTAFRARVREVIASSYSAAASQLGHSDEEAATSLDAAINDAVEVATRFASSFWLETAKSLFSVAAEIAADVAVEALSAPATAPYLKWPWDNHLAVLSQARGSVQQAVTEAEKRFGRVVSDLVGLPPRGGSRKVPRWDHSEFVRFAEQVDAAEPIIRVILDRDEESESWVLALLSEGRSDSEARAALARYHGESRPTASLLHELASDNQLRKLLVQDIREQKGGKWNSSHGALRHVARKMGLEKLNIKTIPPLRAYYERGKLLLDADRETDFLEFTKTPVGVVDVKVRRKRISKSRMTNSRDPDQRRRVRCEA